ncbi:RNA dependent RNA polymerase, partial [uncultured Clostridium sp.]|uniref:RNA dependent RNA polymerase n=1 Tax=uncultured Clostridium sp. TaxID=59620 RepID=UPI002599F43D
MKTTKNLCNHFTFSNEEVEYQIKKNSKEVNGMLSKKYYQDYVMPEDELNYHIKEDLLRCSLQSFGLKEEVVNSFEEINSIRESIVNDIESSIEKLSMKIASKKAINKYYRDYEMPEDELNYYVRRDLVRDCLSTRKYNNDLLQEEVKDEKNYRTLVDLLSKQYLLDEEHIMANTEYRRYKGYVTSFYTAKIDINKKGKINHTNGRYETSLKDAEMICIQESNMTLKLALQGFMQDVFVLKLKYDSSKEDELEIYDTMAEDIIAEGLYIDGKKYRILTQTAAQGRTGKFYIAPANKIHKYRVALSNGVDYTGQKKVLGKLEKRISLGLSSGYILGRRDKKGNIISYYDYDVKYIDDVKKELDIKLILPIEEQVDGVWHFVGKENLLLDLNTCKTKEEYKKYYEYFKPEVTDGFGLIDIRTACKWAYELGCINKKQMVYFMENFVSFDEVLNNDLMKYILDNIPTAYQVRHQWDKGLLVIWDLRAEGIEAEILMNNSMHKEKEEAVTDSTWRICNYNKQKGNFNYLSYQSLQKLGLSDDLLKKLGDNTIAFLTKCLKDPKC